MIRETNRYAFADFRIGFDDRYYVVASDTRLPIPVMPAKEVRLKRYILYCLLSLGLMSSCTLLGQRPGPNPSTIEYGLSAGFTARHINTAPGQCGCFFLYGVSTQLNAGLTPAIAVVTDLGITKATDIGGSNRNFKLVTYQVGMRYTRTYRLRYRPYVQGLAGVAHLSSNFVIDSGMTRTSFSGGAGLDYRLTKHFDLRLFEVMYVGTRFENGFNNYQDQVRLSGGLVVHVSTPKN